MSDIDWTDDGAPRSRRFDDVYFSRTDGLAESRTVFLGGCGLPEAWRGRADFTVGELGFGTGLNILALLALWRRERPAGGRLHVVSVEAYPMRPDEAARALAAWPELAELAAPLLAAWPQAVGVRRVEWPALGATLDVVVGEAAEALAGWDGRADAWFLDGFAPARNPEMWREAVLALVAARSAPGARLATFSVAGAVRRGLQAHGFAVDRQPGHGGKRQRLEAVRAASPPPDGRPAWLARPERGAGEVLVVGGGIAAASMVRALGALGLSPTVLAGPGRGASGNPAALVTPRYELGDTPAARLSAQAFRRAVDLYGEAEGVVLSRGVRQLASAAERERFERLARSPLFASGELTVEPDGPALFAADAMVVDPRRLVDAWLGEARTQGVAAAVERAGGRWIVRDADGRALAEADTVVLAGGFGVAALVPGLPLQPVRGQVSLAPGVSGEAAAWGGYVASTPGGLLFGATHDRDDAGEDVRDEDHRRNLETLRQRFPPLADAAEASPMSGRASVRATTPDRLPLAGPVPAEPFPSVAPGLYVLGGLGSRGFTNAPLLGEHVAAWIAGAPSPLPLPLTATVHPGRFRLRELRRGGIDVRALI